MATIRQRAGKWQCIVKRKGYPLRSKTFDLKKDAEKWARLQERQIDAGQWIDTTEAIQTTLGQVLTRYSQEITPTKRGKDAEFNRIQNLCKSSLAKLSIAALNGRVLSAWRDERLKKVSGSTVNRELSLLSVALSTAMREWGVALPSNPVRLVRKPPEGKARNRVLSNEEQHALLVQCSQCKNPWVQPLVVFTLETACRRGEVLSLLWEDVDLRSRTAEVSGKTGARTVPLSPACVAALQALPRTIDGRVFPISMEALKQAYQRAVQRAGIEDFTFHDLRHDALTRLAKRGFNVLELRAISGHATANMLQRYVRIDAAELAQKLAEHF